MKRSISRTVKFAAAILLAIPLFLRADNADTSEKLVYVPIAPGPINRVMPKPTRDGGGEIPADLSIVVLCPEHTGLTVQEHPSIFWYMNKPAPKCKVRLSILIDGEIEPLVEKDFDGEKAAGIQRIDLKDFAKTLTPKTDYQITVTVIDPTKHQMLTCGHIERIAAPEKLISKLLTRPTPAERAVVYAKQGIWYDALAAISDQIAADPKNKARHQERADLLKQVSLTDAATFDEKAGVE